MCEKAREMKRLFILGLLPFLIVKASSDDSVKGTVGCNKEKSQVLSQENEERIKRMPEGIIMKSCEDWAQYESGRRTIYMSNGNSTEIYCDQETDSGGWNVFQRREDGREDFFREWSDYRQGFGSLEKEFWLGLEILHLITTDGRKYELRFDLEKHNGSKYYAVYDNFYIGSEGQGYAVYFTGFQGNAPDSFTYHKGAKFTTKDRDQDTWVGNCASHTLGAWWFKNCDWSDLNGMYDDSHLGYKKGIYWRKLTGFYESLKGTEMKFRIKK